MTLYVITRSLAITPFQTNYPGAILGRFNPSQPGQVGGIPALYSGAPEFKSRPGDQLL